jgi:hypothetical protein
VSLPTENNAAAIANMRKVQQLIKGQTGAAASRSLVAKVPVKARNAAATVTTVFV